MEAKTDSDANVTEKELMQKNSEELSNESEDDEEESPNILELLGKYRVTIGAHVPPKFAPNDPEAKKYLDENGYVVFKQTATPADVTKAIDLFWTHVETESKRKV